MNKDFKLEIEGAEEQLRQAMLNSDLESLDKLLAPDLVFTNHLGQCLDKDADLSAHKSGALTISRLEPSEQQVKFIATDVAVVSVRMQIVGQYAGQPAGGDFRFTRVWKRSSDGTFQVAAAHASIIV